MLLNRTASPVINDNGLGLVPAMGWNSWNKFACDVTEQNVLDAATTIKALKLDQFYKYINIDDCW
jgi:alpha-galactosidase